MLLYMYSIKRENREGWPLLNVETEVNGDSKRTNDRVLSLVGLLDSSCRYNRFLSCLGCPSHPSTKYYFPHRTLFHFSNLGRQACWVASLCVSEYHQQRQKPPKTGIFSVKLYMDGQNPSSRKNYTRIYINLQTEDGAQHRRILPQKSTAVQF